MKLPLSKVVYIAGPMTGLPQFNVPLFDRQAARLRAIGYTVVSPAELDSQPVRDYALKSIDGKLDQHNKIEGETWGDMLARDVKVISDQVDAICVLPNWYKSRGARLETFVALLCDKSIWQDVNLYNVGERSLGIDEPAQLEELNRLDVIFAIARSFIR
jgi:hypothetical protein